MLVTLRRDPPVATPRSEAIRQYRAAAAFHRTMADELKAACDHRGECAGRPCAEASTFYRNARRCEAQAWLEEHPR